MAEVQTFECVRCEGRGRTPDEVRHVITCNDPSELRTLTFELPDGVSPPLFE
jgi:hypothetical protein